MTEFIILGNTKNFTVFIKKQPNPFDHKTTIHETRV